MAPVPADCTAAFHQCSCDVASSIHFSLSVLHLCRPVWWATFLRFAPGNWGGGGGEGGVVAPGCEVKTNHKILKICFHEVVNLVTLGGPLARRASFVTRALPVDCCR